MLEMHDIQLYSQKENYSHQRTEKAYSNIKDGKYLVGVVKFNQRSFVLTAYLSERKLSGEKYEYQKE